MICVHFQLLIIVIIFIPCPSQKEHGHAQVPVGYEVRKRQASLRTNSSSYEPALT
jgi:hypothetical protein